jgi:cytochrome-b5 reductase
MQQPSTHEKPQPPAPNECCESGCDPCVWDIYRAALQKWEQAQQRLSPPPVATPTPS